MTIPEAASLILQASTMARGGEIFILDMGDPVKILDLAENLIRLHGYEPYKDIDIVFTGLRPGEKLYEELLMNEEGIKNTANNKIFIGKQININEEIFFANLDKLEIAAKKNDKGEVERMLHIIVPTFIRNNQETGENKEAIIDEIMPNSRTDDKPTINLLRYIYHNKVYNNDLKFEEAWQKIYETYRRFVSMVLDCISD